MVGSLAQIILAARNGDDSPWQQILVLVLLAVFWAVGGILKARAAKSEQQKEQQQPPKRPPHPQGRPHPPRLQPRAIKTMPAAESYGTETKVQQAIARVSAEFAELKTPEPILSKPAGLPPERPHLGLPKKMRKPVSPLIAPLSLEFESTNTLRKAILYYEILGKPMALREPQGSGF